MPRCRNCREKFEQYEFNNKFCKKIDCQVQKGLYLSNEAKKSQPKSKLKAYPEVYSKELKEALQSAVNEIARLIDKDCRCIDCHRTEANPCWDGGHRVSRGSHSALRYHLDNIFKQTRYCNSKSEGNKEAYNQGLIDMYGQEYFEYVDSLRLTYKTLKLPNSELPEKVKEARKIVRELKKLDLVYTPKQRIRLRKQYNKRLGIY